jgi:hypothetical protein
VGPTDGATQSRPGWSARCMSAIARARSRRAGCRSRLASGRRWTWPANWWSRRRCCGRSSWPRTRPRGAATQLGRDSPWRVMFAPSRELFTLPPHPEPARTRRASGPAVEPAGEGAEPSAEQIRRGERARSPGDVVTGDTSVGLLAGAIAAAARRAARPRRRRGPGDLPGVAGLEKHVSKVMSASAAGEHSHQVVGAEATRGDRLSTTTSARRRRCSAASACGTATAKRSPPCAPPTAGRRRSRRPPAGRVRHRRDRLGGAELRRRGVRRAADGRLHFLSARAVRWPGRRVKRGWRWGRRWGPDRAPRAAGTPARGVFSAAGLRG